MVAPGCEALVEPQALGGLRAAGRAYQVTPRPADRPPGAPRSARVGPRNLGSSPTTQASRTVWLVGTSVRRARSVARTRSEPRLSSGSPPPSWLIPRRPQPPRDQPRRAHPAPDLSTTPLPSRAPRASTPGCRDLTISHRHRCRRAPHAQALPAAVTSRSHIDTLLTPAGGHEVGVIREFIRARPAVITRVSETAQSGAFTAFDASDAPAATGISPASGVRRRRPGNQTCGAVRQPR